MKRHVKLYVWAIGFFFLASAFIPALLSGDDVGEGFFVGLALAGITFALWGFRVEEANRGR